MKSINDIKHAVYINLETRPDRKVHVEKQLEQIGIKASRFNAIELKHGAIGCSMSHLRCLEMAKKENWEHLLIVEDDIEFLNPQLFKQSLNDFLSNIDDWDVVLIAGNNGGNYRRIGDYCVRITACQTTTGYIVNRHYFDKLITNIKTGVTGFIKNPNHGIIYAIDRNWLNIQKYDKWFLITPLTVVQKKDYSDIEKKKIDYSKLMLALDKPWLNI